MRQPNEKFETYFSSVYGERWPKLFQALENSETQVLRKNIFADYEAKDFSASQFPNSYQVNPDINVHNLRDSHDIQVFYKMDPASVLVATALDVQPEDLVLDVCAAPGGKSLILAEKLNGTGQLVSNEYSNARRERLTRVIREYLPYEMRQNVFVQGKDGNYYGMHKADVFDRVLADVPCSGERHLLENPQEFSEWTKRRSENLAVRQYSLLSSAYLACRVGGQIVYSTCSISPLENDDVVKKLNKKRSVEFLGFPDAAKYPFLEKTEFGYQILPDRSEGYGPMYFSIIRKLQE
ncbi:RsmB/NOP family class I SAM-dependent RNA methyltransferase [Pseudobdellovibrio sp. HCB154]|uniref:RsmB/NOP family class I SAM-dependent RNA methyltransferase n=1 Tax=Pseudobdellovibrio sp. HCB154 TaxID=3386277 RepID=UPI0039173ACD